MEEKDYILMSNLTTLRIMIENTSHLIPDKTVTDKKIDALRYSLSGLILGLEREMVRSER